MSSVARSARRKAQREAYRGKRGSWARRHGHVMSMDRRGFVSYSEPKEIL
jgi:hypothetical protein